MALDRMIMNMWTKLAIDLGHRENQIDENISLRPTKYKAPHMNRIFLNKWNKVSLNEYDKAE